MKTKLTTILIIVLMGFGPLLKAQYPYGILPQRQNMQQEVWDAYVNFRDNHLVSSGCPDPANMLRELHTGSGETRVEYQTFALLLSIYNDDWTTFRKLWRYCQAMSAQNTKSNATVVFPWYANDKGQVVGKGINAENSELVVALYEAYKRDPSATDHNGNSFLDLCHTGVDELWYHDVCLSGPNYTGILGAAGWKCGDANQFIYLHYASPWGYFKRFTDASGDTRWIQDYTHNGRSYESAIDAARNVFVSHIDDYNYHTFCHTVMFDGEHAGISGSDDANPTWFGFGQARGLFKNAVTYTNWGNSTDKYITQFMADFFVNKTGGVPGNIANGYNCTDGGGGGSPKPSMVGAAGLTAMIDAQYQDFLNASWDWMVNNIDNWADDHRESLMGAVYMMGMAGMMDLRLANEQDYLDVSPIYLEFPNTASDETIDISSDLSWTVSTSGSWISVNTSSGSNDATITVSVDANSTSAERTGTVTVENAANAITKTIDIYQQGPTYTLTINNGTGGGLFEEGDVINISADAPGAGMEFTGWTGDISYVENPLLSSTKVTMPNKPITISASYSGESLPQARRVTSAPTIDGSDDGNYGDTEAILKQTIGGVYPESSDLSGTWKTAWDDNNFYILIDIWDDVQFADGPTWYNDDLVEIYIDGDNSKGTSYDGINDFQYAYVWNSSGIREEQKNATSGVDATQVATANGYATEISIPWSTLNISTPSVGDIIGLDVQVCDDDEGGHRQAKLAWSATEDDAWSDPSVFGELKMGDVSVGNQSLAFKASNIQLYPNPVVEDFLVIALNNDQYGKATITLADVNGRVINTYQTSNEPSIKINTNSLATGLYVISIETNNHSIKRKIMIK